MLASEFGHVDVARELLTRGAAVNAANTSSRRTSLMLASMNGHLECARLLLAPPHRADAALLSRAGQSALSYATAAGHFAVAAALRASLGP